MSGWQRSADPGECWAPRFCPRKDRSLDHSLGVRVLQIIPDQDQPHSENPHT